MAAIFFDWIFVAVVWPWPIMALVAAFYPRPALTAADRTEKTMKVPRIA